MGQRTRRGRGTLRGGTGGGRGALLGDSLLLEHHLVVLVVEGRVEVEVDVKPEAHVDEPIERHVRDVLLD